MKAIRRALAMATDESLRTRLLRTLRYLERLYNLRIDPREAKERDLDLKRRNFVESRHSLGERHTPQ